MLYNHRMPFTSLVGKSVNVGQSKRILIGQSELLHFIMLAVFSRCIDVCIGKNGEGMAWWTVARLLMKLLIEGVS